LEFSRIFEGSLFGSITTGRLFWEYKKGAFTALVSKIETMNLITKSLQEKQNHFLFLPKFKSE
jgi:hypothetical protein